MYLHIHAIGSRSRWRGQALTFCTLILTMAITTKQLPAQLCQTADKESVVSSPTLNLETQTAVVQLAVNVRCDDSGHPAGTLKLSGLKLDMVPAGTEDGSITATGFSRLATYDGAAQTAYLTGHCSLVRESAAPTSDCRFWIMFSQPGGSPAVVSYAITQANGTRVLADAGKVVAQSGKLTVTAKPHNAATR